VKSINIAVASTRLGSMTRVWDTSALVTATAGLGFGTPDVMTANAAHPKQGIPQPRGRRA
jgi:hypothetical protein